MPTLHQTIAELTARRALYLEAERAILTGNQSYTVEGMTFTRANLQDIQRQLRELDRQLHALQNRGGFKTFQVRF